VHADGLTIIREGHGTGEGKGVSAGEVHDIALKAAETDATKRALATFGKPFGLALYRGGGKAASIAARRSLSAPATIGAHTARLVPDHAGQAPATSDRGPDDPRVGFHPDDTTPIPRPSHYDGRRHQNPIARHFRDERREAERAMGDPIGPRPGQGDAPAPPLAPAAEPRPACIDKSQLTIAEPKRLRDKAHLKFVAAQPCLVCGRQPCDPHHLRFAQPRALGLKVSDEFTVPLCRGHHRQLHQAGNEVVWWKTLNIDALPIAKGLWEQTHPKSASTDMPQPNDDAAKATAENR
jgi:hypothetical protein